MGRRATPFERLQSLRAQVAAADERIVVVAEENRAAASRAKAAAEALGAYFGDVEAGSREADPEVEARLREAARQAEDAARPEVAGGRLNGAHAARTTRLHAVGAFVQEHRDELQEDLIGQALRESEGLMDTWLAFRAALERWAAVRSEFAQLMPFWGLEFHELPPVPFGAAIQDGERFLAPLMSGRPRDPRRFVPAPSSLLPGEEVPGPASADAEWVEEVRKERRQRMLGPFA